MKRKTRPIPKGRAVDVQALARVQELLGDAPRRRELLIEHLHKLNDHFGHLPAAQLAALAQEMGLALAEVYEVATFYHHFEVVKEGEAPPPALTVRVCDSIACELAGARELLKLDLGGAVRVREPSGFLRHPLGPKPSGSRATRMFALPPPGVKDPCQPLLA